MTDKKDFLSLLRRDKEAGRITEIKKKDPGNLKIQITVEQDGAKLALVDPEGNLQIPTQYKPIGCMGTLIKTLSEIERRTKMDFSWGVRKLTHKFSFADYPFLPSFFEMCAHLLVDKTLQPLTLQPGKRKILFKVSKVNINPLVRESTNKGSFFVDNKEVVAFLSPDYVLTTDSIWKIDNIGYRFADLMAFTVRFDDGMAEILFSILFSTIDRIKVDYYGKKVLFQDDPVRLTPVLAIEMIDSENALYLKVAETVGNLPMEICEDFRLDKVAYVGDKEIVVRKLEESRLDELVELFKNTLEKTTSKKETRTIWNENNYFALPQDVASQFLYNSFGELISTFKIVGAQKLKAYNIVAPKPNMNLKLIAGVSYLEGTATVTLNGEEFTLRDIIAQYTKQKYITLADGNRAVIDAAYIKQLKRVFGSTPKDTKDVTVSFFDLPEMMNLLDDEGKKATCFDLYRKFYEGFNSLKKIPVATPGLKATLRDYQKEGVKWINYLYTHHLGGCLADDMGLGKTVQAIAMLTWCMPTANKPSLIVMPPILIFNWKEEFRKFAPHLKVSTYYGPARNFDEAKKAQVILTTYGTVRNDIDLLSDYQFEYVILDESQNIKNIDAMVTKAVWRLKGNHRLAISGTPIENNLTELYSLFHFLNPTMFGSLKQFGDEYVIPIQKEGDEDAANALRRKVYPFILRRLKKDVLTDLPERTEQVLTVEMSSHQKLLYEQRRKYFIGEIGHTLSSSGPRKASFELLQAMIELRQIASVPEEKSNGMISSPKIDLLMEYLLMAVRNGHKVVVFYNFLAGIELTTRKLEQEKIGYEILTGATRDRQQAVERFQTDDECRVMLMTVKSGGVGLNLVAADTVFIVEPWWNKAAEEQAINRLHRIGQKNAVNCYYLVTADTIEEKIRQLQEKKSAIVEAVISTDSAGGKNLSVEDINYLLS